MNKPTPAKQAADSATRLALFRGMLRLHLIEETVASRYSDQEMRCPVHLSVGQEAAAVGSASGLRKDDWIVSSHRGHAHFLAKGGDLTSMLAEIYGRETGCSQGRGGSMNLTDTRVGALLTLPIVASSIPIGVGVALAEKQRGGDKVTGIYLGDAATEEGVFHEAANFAALKSLAVVFVCENNLYSVYTNIADRQPKRPLHDVAVAHGIRARHGDGNDVEFVHAETREAADRARRGEGPSFLVFDTYRWREHCGPNFDNDIGYRTVEEYESWRVRCPLDAHRAKLRKEGLLDETAEAKMAKEIEAEIEAAFVAAKAAPMPPAADAAKYVYA